jgi:pimeloyl-ACP methyl ester carboxylesterase
VRRRTLIPIVILISSLLVVFVYSYFHTGSARISAANFRTLADYQKQKLTWSNCDKGIQCTTMQVPVDYNNIVPNESFSLFVLRHPATISAGRIGSLFVNPGGPGGSGVDYAYNWDTIISKAVSDKYDIVGFDERGVNHSQPVRCLNDAQEDAYLSNDGKVSGKASLAAAISAAKDFANKCAAAAGMRLGHYGTIDSARDMELLRGLIDEPKLNFMGKSYGTYLGTLYANLYPDRVGRMILDGAIDPKESVANQNIYQAKGFDLALKSYLAANPSITQSSITSTLDRLHSSPLTVGKRKLTQALAITGIAAELYDNQTGWPELTAALKDLKRNSGAKLLAMADDYNYRDKNGHYTNNQGDLQQIITCLDFNDPRSLAQIEADQTGFVKAAPVFGPYLGYAGLSCKFWRAPSKVTTDFTPLTKVSPVVVIGVTRDPATPYEWAVALNHDFKNSVLLTYDGDGHTGHNRGSTCIDSKVDAYLLTGALPSSPVVCKAA